MNIDQIHLNEAQNDGTQLHLYYSDNVHMWIAYGYSAYALRLYVKSRGYDNLRNFSYKFQMPCTVVAPDTMMMLRKTEKIITEIIGSYICFEVKEGINISYYLSWVGKLRENMLSKDGMDTETPVSRFVPKDRFIKDGMSSFARNTKRMMDCFLAFIAMIVFSPLFLACFLAIKFDDGGPAIFKQERIGRFGKPFFIYKFRSMRLDAEKRGPQLSASCGDGDSRLTKVGAFIRAHHLDELPQLWNVFCGDMAFVGPRPERAFYIEQILEYDKRYTYLYQIRPGVTSYATFYNGYTDTMEKMLRRLEYDLYYLGHRSWYFDLKILAMTFFAIVFGKKF